MKKHGFWLCARNWTIYAQEKPNKAEHNSGSDLNLKFNNLPATKTQNKMRDTKL
jgi:hypothetical protein